MSCVAREALPREAPSLVERFGLALSRQRGTIQAIQWTVVGFYLMLLVLPAFASLPAEEAHLYDNLVLFAQFIFWGIWWPFVILSVMVAGRFWCGLFCPEGALSEWASRYGLGRPVPRWMKWSGWPFVAFVLTTIYGQLVSVYGYAKPALLILGGSTVAAVIVGLLYGRGRRVWCRHLCPVSGVFGLLARVAPLHFRVEREAWDRSPLQGLVPVECAPLIDIRRMRGAAECHMCGRCAGHRGAVSLAARGAGDEIVRLRATETRVWEVRLLVFGIFGVAAGAFQWSASPWLVTMKQVAAAWLLRHGGSALLEANAPWWLLTHYPAVNDLFSWLDGLLLLGYVAAMTLTMGSWISLWLGAAARALGGGRAAAAQLAYALIPLAGMGIFLGLSGMTVAQLRGEGITLSWLAAARATLLVVASFWSLSLAWRQMTGAGAPVRRRALAISAVTVAVAGAVTPWVVLFFVW